ncbi:MAG: hypothetical protein HZB77_05520, partial [Chloroflexi bacterium]|nr:hypothetical protein [Chloroflexota bacterium]
GTPRSTQQGTAGAGSPTPQAQATVTATPPANNPIEYIQQVTQQIFNGIQNWWNGLFGGTPVTPASTSVPTSVPTVAIPTVVIPTIVVPTPIIVTVVVP